MMEAYRSYKAWWIKHQAPQHVPSLYWGNTEEEAFKRHVSDLGLYSVLEILDEWTETREKNL